MYVLLIRIFVTVEDSWSPRAGYVFNVLWSGQAELPRVVTLFHDAVVSTAGLKMLFRLWLFGEPVDWPALRDNSPPDVQFSVKITNGDFLLDFPINTLLSCNNASAGCAPHERRLIVEVDAFRCVSERIHVLLLRWRRPLSQPVPPTTYAPPSAPPLTLAPAGSTTAGPRACAIWGRSGRRASPRHVATQAALPSTCGGGAAGLRAAPGYV